MLAILLYKNKRPSENMLKALRYENIEIISKNWEEQNSELDNETLQANIVIINCRSCDQIFLSQALLVLRRNKPYLPIIVLDESGDSKNRFISNETGADLYIKEPISWKDLAIQMKNLISKKQYKIINRWLRAFDVWLDLEQRSVKRNKRFFHLRNKEFSLLEYFMINKGKVLTRNSILEQVWDRNANFASNTVDVHINRLRRKIDDPFKEKLIHTIHCVGYIFEKKKMKAKA